MLGWFRKFKRWEPGKDYDRALALRALVSGENLENPGLTNVAQGYDSVRGDSSLRSLQEAVKQLQPRGRS